MRRRDFITTLFVGASYSKLAAANNLVEAVLGAEDSTKPLELYSDDIISLGAMSELVLPQNVISFNSVVRIKIKKSFQSGEQPTISGGELKIMGSFESLEFDMPGTFTFQYSGDDLGWILV